MAVSVLKGYAFRRTEKVAREPSALAAEGNVPQGLKAESFTADRHGLKPCPFKETTATQKLALAKASACLSGGFSQTRRIAGDVMDPPT